DLRLTPNETSCRILLGADAVIVKHPTKATARRQDAVGQGPPPAVCLGVEHADTAGTPGDRDRRRLHPVHPGHRHSLRSRRRARGRRGSAREVTSTTSLRTKRGRLFFERGRVGLRPTEAACLFYPEGCRNCREWPASALLDGFQFGTDRFGIVLGNVPN